jgi:uncharacterized membrane protein (TIGR02234 family)
MTEPITEPMTDRRTFAPVVLAGLAGSGLAAVAGNRAWVSWAGESADDFSVLSVTGDDSATVPLAGALALVLLACWGVVLVTRGRFRRLVAGLGLVVALGMLVTAVLGPGSATTGLRDDLQRLGVEDVSTQLEGWYWAYLGAAVVALVASALAVRWLPQWPEMGQRYDAPGSRSEVQHPEHRADATGLDLWKAMDEGRDPTLPERRPTDP